MDKIAARYTVGASIGLTWQIRAGRIAQVNRKEKGGCGNGDKRLTRIVAIKVLPQHIAEKPEAKALFERAKTVSVAGTSMGGGARRDRPQKGMASEPGNFCLAFCDTRKRKESSNAKTEALRNGVRVWFFL